MPAGYELPIMFDELREKNVEALKMLNSVVLPVRTPDQVIKDCMKYPNLTHMAYHNDVLVGAVAARCEMQSSGIPRVYIATLAVLAPYRGYGIGRRLLAQCLAGVTDETLKELVVHVQEGNDDAIRFYKAAGFEVKEIVQDYYKNLTPCNALLLHKRLRE
eukprot:CAMPEP_0119109078 /NCGR_PEP_ID=MMETSP1180-20130426/17156_1 /TAXON_ID=3052 ORGANISM="Chlamydomonas cf sp, Strain CCMP681" /NCGR_SAMPLE_ID=MMETSP1180 /ASSEMBLY_ACC=CAM_ASM_000741 /LENGTH=159 /DNA_ID=CAMNT_0007094789 /DNA_START=68 /DNA_END=547 /DNA_ORIENTATION=-